MSDLAIIAAVALVSAAVVAVVWLRQRAAAAIRAEQRDERDNGLVARLRGSVEQCEAEMRALTARMKTFEANNRSLR